MSSDKADSSLLRLSRFSSHASIPSTTPPPVRVPSLSLSICTGGAGGEEQLVVSSEDGHGHRSVRARKNKQSALRSRARKKAYTEELEKKVQGLLQDNLKLKRQCKQHTDHTTQEQEARDVAGGSRQHAAELERLQLPRLHLQHHPPTCSPASLSLGIGTSGEEQLVVSSEDGHGHGHRSVRARKNKQSALRSRARKKAYTQELEKEVQGLLEDNLKLKRQCKQHTTQEQEARDVAGGSRQLAAEPERLQLPRLHLQLQHHPPTRSPASLSLGIGTGGEEQLVVSNSEDGHGHRSVRVRKNNQPTLRSRARKKAYTQELEKEVQGLLEDNLKLKRQCKQEQEARDVAGGSRQLAAKPERLQLPRLHLQHHPPTCSPASLSLGIGTGGEEQLVVSSEDGHGHRSVRARKNKQLTLRSRAKKKAYTQELEKEVQGLLQDNLKLKRQCKQVCVNNFSQRLLHPSASGQATGRAAHAEEPHPLSSSNTTSGFGGRCLRLARS